MNLDLAKIHPHSEEVMGLIADLNQYLWEQYPEDQEEYASHNHLPLDTTLIVARINGKAVGCGAFRPFSWDSRAVEVKRMYVAPDARGLGIGKALLAKLEALAAESGYTITRLETGNRQVEAVGLYEASGYQLIPNYPPYEDMPLSLCYEKVLS